MKKLLVSAGVAGLLFAGAATATAAPDNSNACFGQARAASGQAGVVGFYASDRKGTNSSINHAFMNGEYTGWCGDGHSGNPGGQPE